MTQVVIQPAKLGEILQEWLHDQNAALHDLAHIARASETDVKAWLKGNEFPQPNQFTRLRRAVSRLNFFRLPPKDEIAAMRQEHRTQQAKRREGEKVADQPESVFVVTDKLEPSQEEIITAAVEFGTRLKQARVANNVSARDLASTLDVHVTTVHRWEGGQPFNHAQYTKIIAILKELDGVPAPVYDPSTKETRVYTSPTKLVGTLTAKKTLPSPSVKSVVPPVPPTPVSPLQGALAATPWALPSVATLVNAGWAQNFIVTNHAHDRFSQRYMGNKRVVPTDRAQLGNLLQICWERGWYEKIAHAGEDFFIIALPGLRAGDVFYALLREDQIAHKGTRKLVAITVLSSDMRNQRNGTWDVKLNTPFKALLDEASLAQQLVPQREASEAPKASSGSTPAIEVHPNNPSWIRRTVALAPWLPSISASYKTVRYIAPRALQQYRDLVWTTRLGEISDLRLGNLLDYTVDRMIRDGLYAQVHNMGTNWKVVPLPACERSGDVTFALVRPQGLHGGIFAIVDEISSDKIEAAISGSLRVNHNNNNDSTKPSTPITRTPVVSTPVVPTPVVHAPAPSIDDIEQHARAMAKAYAAVKTFRDEMRAVPEKRAHIERDLAQLDAEIAAAEEGLKAAKAEKSKVLAALNALRDADVAAAAELARLEAVAETLLKKFQALC